MSRGRIMSKAERAALADALRHMRQGGVRHAELSQVAGSKVRLAYIPVRLPVARRPS